MKNALTIDLEEFFQIHVLSRIISPGQWPKQPSCVEKNTQRVLDILEPGHIHATFFCLGWVAERHPDLIKRIHSMGHEIACHGYSHQVIYNQTPKGFKKDIIRAKAILEDITGQGIIGYRAPTYSITRKTMWALDILEELGFRYDSSIFPIHHDNYGIPGSPRHPYQHQGMNLVEFPISTLAAGPVNLPISGGGYFRLLPYGLTKFALKRLQNRDRPFIFYLHPWEFNPDEPRPHKLPPLSAFRTYIGLTKTAARFSRLVDDFEFSTVSEVLKTMGLLD